MHTNLPTDRALPGGKIAASLCLVLVATVSSAPAGTLSAPRAVPSDAWMVFSVPDVPSAWKALVATPIYQEAVGFFDTPAVAGLPAYRQFLAQVRQIEAELGYPLDGATLTQMVAGFDFIFLPPHERGEPSLSVCVFRVTDAPRFRRLMDLIERRMGDVASDRTASGPPVKHERYQDVEIVSSSLGAGLALAELTPDRFVLGNHPAAIRRIIEQRQSRKGLESEPLFRRTVAGLRQAEPHGFLFLNSGEIGASLRRSGLAGLALSSLVRGFRDEIVLGADFRIERAAISFESFIPFGDPAEDRLAAIYRHYPPGRLRSLDYVSSSPLAFTARNTLDGPALYESLRAVVLGSIRALVPANQTPERRLELAEESFRAQMGFDLRDDLAPAIGPEAFVSVEQVHFDPVVVLPTVDLVTGVQVRSAERMDRVITGFEGFIERRLGATRQPAQPSSGLHTTTYQGSTIKWFALPVAPLYSIAYARRDDFVLVGLGPDSIRHAIDRANSQRGAFASGGLHVSLRPYLHEQANQIFVLNVSKLVLVGRELVHRLAEGDQEMPDSTKQVENLLVHMGQIAALGASTAGSELGLQTRGALVFSAAESENSSRR